MLYDEILNEILDDHDGRSEHYDFEDSSYLVEFEDDGWDGDDRYMEREVVYESKKHNVFLMVCESCTGSYHKEYSIPHVRLVKKIETIDTRTEVTWEDL